MFVRLENTPRDYAWGSTTAIAELLGRAPSGGPEAELWLGTHTGSPTRIADPAQVGGHQTLAAWVAAEPELTLGRARTQSPDEPAGKPSDGPAAPAEPAEPAALPFLLKILAAAHPLSLQAHPSIAQAREGFAREEAAGVPLTSPSRNYKDRNHKPELIVALSPTFEALCGFRAVDGVVNVLQEFIDRGAEAGQPVSALEAFVTELGRHGNAEEAVAWALEWLLTGSNGVHNLVTQCGAVAAIFPPLGTDTSHKKAVAEAATVRELGAEYPGDPGIVLAILLNRVSLKRGEALYLPAGNMHAYLSGLGVELMASSDNVLRGGLTPKHIDVAELVAITQCAPLDIPLLSPKTLSPGVTVFAPAVPDFALVHVSLEQNSQGGQASVRFDGPAIVICTEGELTLSGERSSVTAHRGEFFFVTPDEGVVALNGFGEIFAARQGLSRVLEE